MRNKYTFLLAMLVFSSGIVSCTNDTAPPQAADKGNSDPNTSGCNTADAASLFLTSDVPAESAAKIQSSGVMSFDNTLADTLAFQNDPGYDAGLNLADSDQTESFAGRYTAYQFSCPGQDKICAPTDKVVDINGAKWCQTDARNFTFIPKSLLAGLKGCQYRSRICTTKPLPDTPACSSKITTVDLENIPANHTTDVVQQELQQIDLRVAGHKGYIAGAVFEASAQLQPIFAQNPGLLKRDDEVAAVMGMAKGIADNPEKFAVGAADREAAIAGFGIISGNTGSVGLAESDPCLSQLAEVDTPAPTDDPPSTTTDTPSGGSTSGSETPATGGTASSDVKDYEQKLDGLQLALDDYQATINGYWDKTTLTPEDIREINSKIWEVDSEKVRAEIAAIEEKIEKDTGLSSVNRATYLKQLEVAEAARDDLDERAVMLENRIKPAQEYLQSLNSTPGVRIPQDDDNTWAVATLDAAIRSLNNRIKNAMDEHDVNDKNGHKALRDLFSGDDYNTARRYETVRRGLISHFAEFESLYSAEELRPLSDDIEEKQTLLSGTLRRLNEDTLQRLERILERYDYEGNGILTDSHYAYKSWFSGTYNENRQWVTAGVIALGSVAAIYLYTGTRATQGPLARDEARKAMGLSNMDFDFNPKDSMVFERLTDPNDILTARNANKNLAGVPENAIVRVTGKDGKVRGYAKADNVKGKALDAEIIKHSDNIKAGEKADDVLGKIYRGVLRNGPRIAIGVAALAVGAILVNEFRNNRLGLTDGEAQAASRVTDILAVMMDKIRHGLALIDQEERRRSVISHELRFIQRQP